jgi:glutamine amidotransferase
MLREMYPDNSLLHEVSEETRLIVSEPLGDLPGAWREVPESSCGVVQPGDDEIRPFTPLHGNARIRARETSLRRP